MTSPPAVFDTQRLRLKRDRASALFDKFDFLKRAVSSALLERLDDVNRQFAQVLELGCHTGTLTRDLAARPGVARVVAVDPSAQMLRGLGNVDRVETLHSGLEHIDLPPQQFDLVVSAMALHWVNDLPGLLIQLRQLLKPDGLLIAGLIGGHSLIELRRSLLQAEAEVTGGAAARVAPFMDGLDGGGLLQRAGFAMPVADTDTLTVRYDGLFNLLQDLRGMGEASSLAGAVKPLRHDVLLRAAEIYAESFGLENGRVPARFDIVWLSGWSPAPHQPQPKRPGSATHSLAEAIGKTEIPAGDKAG